jgi:uncharacterized protein YcbK (DUF882 family)
MIKFIIKYQKHIIITIILVVIIALYKAKANNMEAQDINEIQANNTGNFTSLGVPKTSHFSVNEFNCNDGTKVPTEYYGNVQALMNQLEIIRTALGNKPIKINSGYRTQSYNTKVGGKPASMHLVAKAADIVVTGVTPAQVQAKIKQLMDDGKIKAGGIGKYPGFTHYDIRGVYKTW